MTPDQLRRLQHRLAAAGDHEAARAAEGLALALKALVDVLSDDRVPPDTRQRVGRVWALIHHGEPTPTGVPIPRPTTPE